MILLAVIYVEKEQFLKVPIRKSSIYCNRYFEEDKFFALKIEKN